jgi:hypothetical protein
MRLLLNSRISLFHPDFTVRGNGGKTKVAVTGEREAVRFMEKYVPQEPLRVIIGGR